MITSSARRPPLPRPAVLHAYLIIAPPLDTAYLGVVLADMACRLLCGRCSCSPEDSNLGCAQRACQLDGQQGGQQGDLRLSLGRPGADTGQGLQQNVLSARSSGHFLPGSGPSVPGSNPGESAIWDPRRALEAATVGAAASEQQLGGCLARELDHRSRPAPYSVPISPVEVPSSQVEALRTDAFQLA